MAASGFTPISLYYSTTVGGSPPSAGNLVSGELAINIADGKLWYKDSGGSVQLIASKAGASGDVVGPAGATDNAAAIFDSTTGKLIKNSKVIITPVANSSTLTIANNKTVTVNNTLTLSGTDSTTMTFPSTSATIARTDSAQTFTGVQTFSSDASVNGITVGRGAGAVATNTAVGASALATPTSGTDVAAFGKSSLAANTSGAQNSAFGSLSLTANLTGSDNTAIGYASLFVNTAGGQNTAVGREALRGNTTASNNTAVGYQAGHNNTAADNTFLGHVAGYYVTTGTQNVYVGRAAGPNSAASTGSYNVAVGYTALYSNTTASNNTAVGYQAGYSNTTGATITAVGRQALYANTTGSNNVALGNSALYANTTGTNNVSVGDYANGQNTTGSYNVAVGRGALDTNTTSQQNTAVGYQALYNVLPATISVSAGALTNGVEYTITGLGTVNWTSIGAASATVGVKFTYNNVAITGSGGSVTQNVNAANTAIGYGSGSAITTGTKNTIIGAYNGNQGSLDIRTASNYIVLSDGDGNPRAYSNGSGSWYYGCDQSGGEVAIFVNRSATPYGTRILFSGAAPNNTGQYFLYCDDTGGQRATIRANGGIANYQANDANLSDRREKTNFAPAKNYLDAICAIPVQTFNYIDQSEDDPGLTLGVVAQDVQAVAPELVTESNWGTKDDPKMRLSIYQTDLQYALMKCIQELKSELDSVKAELAALKGA